MDSTPDAGTLSVRVGEAGTLEINGRPIQTRFSVRAAAAQDARVFVLFDPDANPRKHWGTFANLAALDAGGKELWLADTATTTTGDCFTAIESVTPLVVYSWSGYSCTIEPETGHIQERRSTK